MSECVDNYISKVNSTIKNRSGVLDLFVGEFENVSQFAEVSVIIDSVTTTGDDSTLSVLFSIDGVTFDKRHDEVIKSGVSSVFNYRVVTKYCAVFYVPGDSTTKCRIQTMYHKRNTGFMRSITTGKTPDGTYVEDKVGGSAFKTTSPLLTGVTYSSGFLDQRGYSQVQTHILSSHIGQITITFAMDEFGTDVVRQISIPYNNVGVYSFFAAPHFSDYVRYEFENTSGLDQTQFYYETLFWTVPINAQILGVEDFIATGMTSNLNRSVIVARDVKNNYTNVRSDFNGNLKTSIATDQWTSLGIDQILIDFSDTVSIKNKTLFKFGRNPDIDAGVFETVWLSGGDEILPTGNTIDTIVSDDILDTQEIRVEGHILVGSDLIFTVQTATLTGTTPVILSTPLVRCTRIYNNNGTELVGEILVTDSGTGFIHNSIGAGEQQSEKCQTAFSSTDYGLITQVAGGIGSKTTALVEFKLEIKLPNGVFRTRFEFSTSGNSINIPLQPYIIVPKNSDVRIRGKSNTNNTEVFASMNFLLLQVE